MNTIKKVLTHRLFQPIISLVAIIESLVIALIGWNVYHSSQSTNNQTSNNGNSNLFILLLIIIVVTLIMIVITMAVIRNTSKKSIINRLCELQNTYLIEPNFVTSEEHTKVSKEKDLAKGGTAKILTNSLTYDMSCSSDIADNIRDGARYIYILPNTNLVLDSVEQYITKIATELGDVVTCTDFLKNNIEFWFFDSKILSLYNFATLRQTANDQILPFDQAWWYINPNNNSPSSYMLTKEINNANDQNKLSEVFEDLEKCSSKHDGQAIFDHRQSLKEYIRR